MTARRFLPLLALLLVASLAPVGAGAQPSPPVLVTDGATPGADPIADDVLQITVDRLHAEAGKFFGGDYWSLSVVRLSDGHLAAANGDRRHVSLSSAKAIWVALAAAEFGTAAIENWAEPIFVNSDNGKASRVLSLWVDDPEPFNNHDGADAVNDAMGALGLDDSYLYGWFNHSGGSYGYHKASTGPLWYTSNFVSTSDLARFWALVGNGEVLGPARRAVFLEWARLPRAENSSLIVPRLPAAVAEQVAHKAGWNGARTRRIDGGLVTTPSGEQYAVAISFRLQAWQTIYWDYGAKRWGVYASCEIYNVVAGTDLTCTRSVDPYDIRNDTARPIGALSVADATRSSVTAHGWALDHDSGADPINVKIEVDGDHVGTLTADQLKTWVHAQHGMGNYHGFGGTLPADLSPGQHEVCAIGINDSGSGPNHTLGCKDVTVSTDHQPVGNLAAATARKDLIHARGWARDLDTEDPIKVKLTIDGVKLRNVWADGDPAGHGFKSRTSVPLAPGDYEICAIGLNHEGAGPDTPIGCLTVTVPDDWPPEGTLVDASADASGVTVKGRAWDDDTTAAIEVKVEVDGTEVGSLTADRGSANRKYSGTIAIPLTAGEHAVCTVAVNHTGGEPATDLGCETVTVDPI